MARIKKLKIDNIVNIPKLGRALTKLTKATANLKSKRVR